MLLIQKKNPQIKNRFPVDHIRNLEIKILKKARQKLKLLNLKETILQKITIEVMLKQVLKLRRKKQKLM